MVEDMLQKSDHKRAFSNEGILGALFGVTVTVLFGTFAWAYRLDQRLATLEGSVRADAKIDQRIALSEGTVRPDELQLLARELREFRYQTEGLEGKHLAKYFAKDESYQSSMRKVEEKLADLAMVIASPLAESGTLDVGDEDAREMYKCKAIGKSEYSFEIPFKSLFSKPPVVHISERTSLISSSLYDYPRFEIVSTSTSCFVVKAKIQSPPSDMSSQLRGGYVNWVAIGTH